LDFSHLKKNGRKEDKKDEPMQVPELLKYPFGHSKLQVPLNITYVFSHCSQKSDEPGQLMQLEGHSMSQ